MWQVGFNSAFKGLIPLYDFMVFPRTILRSPFPDTIRTTIPKIGRAERHAKIVDKIWPERKKTRQLGTRDKGQKGNVEMDPKILGMRM
jgi:hypothetical protein